MFVYTDEQISTIINHLHYIQALSDFNFSSFNASVFYTKRLLSDLQNMRGENVGLLNLNPIV